MWIVWIVSLNCVQTYVLLPVVTVVLLEYCITRISGIWVRSLHVVFSLIYPPGSTYPFFSFFRQVPEFRGYYLAGVEYGVSGVLWFLLWLSGEEGGQCSPETLQNLPLWRTLSHVVSHYTPRNRPNSQIPECTHSISHNAPFRTEILNGALWEIEQVNSGICKIGLDALQWRHKTIKASRIVNSIVCLAAWFG